MAFASLSAGQVRADARTHRHLLEGSAWLLIGVAITALTGSVFWLLAAHLFPTGAVGRGAALWTSVLFVNYATAMGLPVAVAKFTADDTRPAGALLGWSVALTTVTSALGTIAFLLIVRSSSFASLWDWGRPTGYLLMFVMTAGGSVAVLVDMRLMAARRWGWVLARFTAVGLLRIPLLWLPGIHAHPAFWLFVFAAGPVALSGVVGVALLRRLTGDELTLRRPERMREAIEYSSVNYAATLASDAPKFVLPVIVLLSVTSVANAVFYVAWSITAIVFVVPVVLSQVLLVEGAKPGAGQRAQIRIALVISIALMAMATVGTLLLSDAIVPIYGAAYKASAHLLSLLMVGAVPWAVTSVYLTQARLVHDRLATVAITLTLGGAILVPAAVLVPRYGLNGAAAAWIVGNIAAALTSVWATHRRALAPRPDPMASAPQPVGAR